MATIRLYVELAVKDDYGPDENPFLDPVPLVRATFNELPIAEVIDEGEDPQQWARAMLAYTARHFGREAMERPLQKMFFEPSV